MSYKNNIEEQEVVTLEFDGESVSFENKLFESGKRMAEIMIPALSSAAFNAFAENLKNIKRFIHLTFFKQ